MHISGAGRGEQGCDVQNKSTLVLCLRQCSLWGAFEKTVDSLHLVDNFPVTELISENRGVEVPAVCRPGVFNYIRSCTEIHSHSI